MRGEKKQTTRDMMKSCCIKTLRMCPLIPVGSHGHPVSFSSSAKGTVHATTEASVVVPVAMCISLHCSDWCSLLSPKMSTGNSFLPSINKPVAQDNLSPLTHTEIQQQSRIEGPPTSRLCSRFHTLNGQSRRTAASRHSGFGCSFLKSTV